MSHAASTKFSELRVGIVGATGYTAGEAARLLVNHPSATLTLATSRSDAGRPLTEIHPFLTGRCDQTLQELNVQTAAERCDVVLCCLPHAASAETVKQLVDVGLRVIDFSADFRLSSVQTYTHWYDTQHPWPDRVGSTVYGLPEFYHDEIKDADIVANPGCYPTSAILPLAPLVARDIIQTTDIIVDSKSGVSGAGRSPKLTTLYCETNEAIAAYSVAKHRHQPEIEDLVERIGGQAIEVLFTPHLTPMDRGILSTIYAKKRSGGAAEVLSCWREVYHAQPFIHVVDEPPSTKAVSGTNFVHLAARDAGDRVILLCVIDNLIKGASGAAIQNMNLMFGLDQTLGLM